MERRKMIWISRLYVVFIAAVIGWCFAIHSVLPLMFVWTPRFYCGWFHQTLGLTQHAGMAMNVADHRLNTRTVYINPGFAFPYMHILYHFQHHMLPLGPPHALPKPPEPLNPDTPPPSPRLCPI